ncbi:MAG TPA: hypothetical protein O0X70_04745 [Methanocorpusculum sp.]|nr:hypothetical protein [Methanocorpusculum sp.]
MTDMDYVIRNRLKDTGLTLDEWKAILAEHNNTCASCKKEMQPANLYPVYSDGKYVPMCTYCRARK